MAAVSAQQSTSSPISTVTPTYSRKQIRWAKSTPEMRHQMNVNKRKLPTPSQYAARNVNPSPDVHNLGTMQYPCSDCGALHFKKEQNTRRKFSSCCASGTVILDAMTPYPDMLQYWITANDETSKNFRANIRKYNSAVAFASFGYQPAKLSRGLPVFVIHGQFQHITSASSS